MATLPDLLPTTPYLIAYTLPLFLVSVVLTFAGAFLILDRTRRFSPRYDALPGTLGSSKGLKELMILEGGVGGLLLGYAFGVHLSTFLALIITTTSSSSANLSDGAFVAIWLLSALTTTILCGRYSIAAILLAGISGGALFSLAICVIIHPPLSVRVILTAVLMCLLTLALGLSLFIPALSRFKHPFLRFAASSVGAFGVTLSIALFAHSTPSWSDAWSHLYVADSISWGTSIEKGFSALFCILLIAGAACDYLLWRKWGECPDEKWDNYLAEYATNLPNRAGTFHPFGSVWDRVFGHGHDALDTKDHKVIFPLSDIEMGTGNSDMKPPLLRYDTAATMVNEVESLSMYKLPPGLLKKGRRSSVSASKTAPRGFRRKEPVKFRPVDEISSDEEDEKHGLNYRKEMDRLRAIKRRTGGASPGLSDTENSAGGPPDYSDFEDDMEKESTVVEDDIAAPSSDADLQQQWTPRFIQRHRSSQSHSSSSPTQSMTSSQRTAVAPTQPTAVTPTQPTLISTPKPTSTPTLTQQIPTSTPVSLSMPTPGSPIPLFAPAPVPATPSLLNALDRVEKARREAFQTSSSPRASANETRTSEAPLESRAEARIPIREEGRGQRWQEFWREVKDVERENRV